MNKWQLIQDFAEANKIPANANTRNTATIIAMSCITAGFDEEKTKQVAIASSNVFREMAIDTTEGSMYKEYDKDVFFSTVMNVYLFLYTEAMYGESELAQNLTDMGQDLDKDV